MIQRAGQAGQSQPIQPPKENAFVAFVKSAIHSVQYFAAQYFGNPEVKNAIKEVNKIHAEIIDIDRTLDTTSQSVHSLSTSIKGVFQGGRTPSDPANRMKLFSFTLKHSFEQLTDKRQVLERLLQDSHINGNKTITDQIKSEIASIDKEIRKISESGQGLNIDVVKEHQGDLAKISQNLSNVQIGNKTVNIAEGLASRGINISNILLRFPNDPNLEKNLIRLYQALENRDSFVPQVLGRQLAAIKFARIDPSIFLYQLSKNLENTQSKISNVTTEELTSNKLAQEIGKTIPWLFVTIIEGEDAEEIRDALLKLQSEGTEPIGKLLSIEGVKGMNTANIISRLQKHIIFFQKRFKN